jgi:hypothetical protein
VWPHVIESLGPHVVAAGFLSESERVRAHNEMKTFILTDLYRQVMVMREAVGTRRSRVARIGSWQFV